MQKAIASKEEVKNNNNNNKCCNKRERLAVKCYERLCGC